MPSGHFMAIVGPSGCGKTTLLKTIAGLNEESDGDLIWCGRNLAKEKDFEPAEIGYVPQFSIAYDQLTVDESIESAMRLRVQTENFDELDKRIDTILKETGLTNLADQTVKVLSGGQKRRLGLALELVTSPPLLLCDEVTSGLDPRSERDIVHLLHQLSQRNGRTVVSVTHSLAHLELYDSVLVLHEGRVAYHGPPEEITHYFSVDDTEEIYPRLARQRSEKWHLSWQKHREAYYRKIEKRRDELTDQQEPTISEEDSSQAAKSASKPATKPASKPATILLEENPAEDDEIIVSAPSTVITPGVTQPVFHPASPPLENLFPQQGASLPPARYSYLFSSSRNSLSRAR